MGDFFALPSKWYDRKDQHRDNLPLCIIQGEHLNGRAPIMICSYGCHGVEKAFIRTYTRMDKRTDERPFPLHDIHMSIS